MCLYFLRGLVRRLLAAGFQLPQFQAPPVQVPAFRLDSLDQPSTFPPSQWSSRNWPGWGPAQNLGEIPSLNPEREAERQAEIMRARKQAEGQLTEEGQR